LKSKVTSLRLGRPQAVHVGSEHAARQKGSGSRVAKYAHHTGRVGGTKKWEVGLKTGGPKRDERNGGSRGS